MKLRKFLASTVAGFAMLASVPALADAHNEQPAAETAEAPGKPALWKVADEDTTIYLFGTVHMLPADVDWNSGPVNDALASADALVTEVDMTPENMAEMGAMFQQAGMLTTGGTLRDLMTEDQRATYEAGLAKLGIPAAAFDPLEPWAASLALLQVTTQASGFDPNRGVETVLESLTGDDVERVALETVEFQIAVFDELPIDDQVLFLLEGAEDPMEGIKVLNELVSEWAEGDVTALGNLMNAGLEASPLLADRLLYSRNANWAEWIEDRLDSTPGTVFIAVGAGHLAGEKSVQDYLAQRDIETVRIQ